MRVSSVNHKIRKQRVNHVVKRKMENQQQNGTTGNARMNVSARVNKIINNAKVQRRLTTNASPPLKAARLSVADIQEELCSSQHTKGRQSKKVTNLSNVKRKLSYPNAANAPGQKIMFGLMRGNEDAGKRGFPVPSKKPETVTSISTADANNEEKIPKCTEHCPQGGDGAQTSSKSDKQSAAAIAEKVPDPVQMEPVHPAFPNVLIRSKDKFIALMRTRKDKGGGADYARRLFKSLYTEAEIITMTAKGKGFTQKAVPQDVLDAVEMEALDKFNYLLYFKIKKVGEEMEEEKEESHNGKKKRNRKKPSDKTFPPGVVPKGKVAREVTIVELFNDMKANIQRIMNDKLKKKSGNKKSAKKKSTVIEESDAELDDALGVATPGIEPLPPSPVATDTQRETSSADMNRAISTPSSLFQVQEREKSSTAAKLPDVTPGLSLPPTANRHSAPMSKVQVATARISVMENERQLQLHAENHPTTNAMPTPGYTSKYFQPRVLESTPPPQTWSQETSFGTGFWNAPSYQTYNGLRSPYYTTWHNPYYQQYPGQYIPSQYDPYQYPGQQQQPYQSNGNQYPNASYNGNDQPAPEQSSAPTEYNYTSL